MSTKLLEKQFNACLKGKVIKNVRYMTETEAHNFGWFSRPLVIFFTDGTYMYASADDEGNDGGAIFTNLKDHPILPVER